MSVFQNQKKKFIIAFGLVGVLLLFMVFFLVSNKVAPVSWGAWGKVNTHSGIAARGYDVVAYHTENAARSGNPSLTATWQGATWQFSSEENKKLFTDNPEQYAPQFGGYCAFAVSKGFTAEASPDAFLTENGKLYLFNGEGPKNDWVAGSDAGIAAAAQDNWSKR